MNRLFPIIATLAMLFAYTTGVGASEKVVEVEGSIFQRSQSAKAGCGKSSIIAAIQRQYFCLLVRAEDLAVSKNFSEAT